MWGRAEGGSSRPGPALLSGLRSLLHARPRGRERGRRGRGSGSVTPGQVAGGAGAELPAWLQLQPPAPVARRGGVLAEGVPNSLYISGCNGSAGRVERRGGAAAAAGTMATGGGQRLPALLLLLLLRLCEASAGHPAGGGAAGGRAGPVTRPSGPLFPAGERAGGGVFAALQRALPGPAATLRPGGARRAGRLLLLSGVRPAARRELLPAAALRRAQRALLRPRPRGRRRGRRHLHG